MQHWDKVSPGIVRQPIYKSALDQWRNYEPFLHEPKASLSDEIAAYPA